MGILNVSTPSIFFHPKTLTNRNFKPNSKFHRTPLFSTHFFSSKATKFQTLAHFGQPTNRPNYLRKKLQQVSPNKLLNDSTHTELHKNSSVSSNGVEEGVSEGTKVDNSDVEKQSKSKFSLGESVLLSRLENWVEQYKKDFEYWGVGSGPIFTVYEDSSGGVKRVLVDEDEILLRCRVEREVIKDFPEVSNKILNARNMAMEMENGKNVIARNSSVAKFVVQGEDEVVEGGFVNAVRSFVAQPGLLPKISGVSRKVLFVLVVLWAVKKLFTFGGDKEVEYTQIEKEMMRRKIKARKEKEMLVKGAIEVIPEPMESSTMDIKKPKLDKDQLRNNILKAKASADKLLVQDASGKVTNRFMDVDYKVQEIQEMARQARKIEGRNNSLVSRDMKKDDTVTEELSDEMEVVQNNVKEEHSLSNHQNEVERKTMDNNAILEPASVDVTENIDNSALHVVVPADASNVLVPSDGEINKQELEFTENSQNNMDLKDRKGHQPSASPVNGESMTKESSVKKKPRIIRSVKEARDYLLKKHDKKDPDTESKFEHVKETFDSRPSSVVDFNVHNGHVLGVNNIVSRLDTSNKLSDSKPEKNASEDPSQKDKDFGPTMNDNIKDFGVEPGVSDLQKYKTTLDSDVNGTSAETEDWQEQNIHEVEPMINQVRGDSLNEVLDSKHATNASEDSNKEHATNASEDSNKKEDEEFDPAKDDYFKGSGVEPGVEELQKFKTTLNHEINGVSTEKKVSEKTENWLEKNFHEVEPIIGKIGTGFRDNYMVARERVNQPLDIPTETESLGFGEDCGELDWMKDDQLRDIVFQVRENELSGRDPFYMVNAEDKEAFIRGLEKKVEQENKKLSHLHEWLHSNIENLDYGIDGISIYDPPEKIIPRWKGPPVEKIPEILNGFLEQRKTNSTQNLNLAKKDVNGLSKESADSSLQEKVNGSIAPTKKLKNPKTVIEGSDGSVKAGKKSGKEYWQHTKKWSQGFLESYNAETDPEIKSTMKDIGKDLDRWITEKEIEEAADLMDKLPEKNRSFIEKKLSKLKREMELFGPQAVVSKYREYGNDKEKDYLWWLDLPYVLCIEMYTIDDGEERVGFYSLEMAADLELEPKPNHVIAFQDANDCKNLCYIIQAHLDMLGKGTAFVVARPPKDTFREAKANGFGVTVIKKGELQLNIDQPLEEVEEEITEIGSKIYHDMMMKERSVDMNSIMKGVFGFNDNTRKRIKRKLKKPSKG